MLPEKKINQRYDWRNSVLLVCPHLCCEATTKGKRYRKIPDGLVAVSLSGALRTVWQKQVFIKDLFTERISYASNMRLLVFIRHILGDHFCISPQLSPTYACCCY